MDREEVHRRIDELISELDTEDVGQKRYLMYRVFDLCLDAVYSEREEEVEVTERVNRLQRFDGYLYKLSQDFLVSSSTGEKHRKLEKIVDNLERKLD